MTFKTLIFKEKDGLGNVVFCSIDQTAKGYKNYLTTIPKLFGNDTTAEGLEALGVDMSELELIEIELYFVPDFPQRCSCCGSIETYLTQAVHCNRCAVNTEI